MSGEENARRTAVSLKFNGSDVSAKVSKYLKSLSFTDNEADSLDDLSIVIDDREGIWLKSWVKGVQSETTSAATAETGNSVTVKNGALFYDGAKPQAWVYEYSGFSVISQSGDKVVVGINGAVTGAFKAADVSISENTGEAAGKKTVIEAAIISENTDDKGGTKILSCGSFEIDSVTAGGPPSLITIKATSLSYTGTSRNQLFSKAWENIHLSEIAAEIAKKCNTELYFSSEYDPLYKRVEQSKERNLSFLSRLCKAAGAALKVSAGTVIIFDEAANENRAATATLYRKNVESYSFNLSANDAEYGSCHEAYTDPTSGITYEYTYTPRASESGAAVLEISEKVSSKEEARQLCMKRLRQKNSRKLEASITVIGNTELFAGNCINLSDFGGLDGKYVISSAEHSIYAESGYKTYLKLRTAEI